MKNMKLETKVKLIYSGELLIFAVVFLVLGILKITGVWGYDDGRRQFFNYLTTAGGTWLIIDLIWALASKKRRKRICLLDKFLNLPLAILLLTFNIICFTQEMKQSFYVVMMSFVFFYISIDYTFQGIYHFYNPLPSLMEEIRKAEEAEQEETIENPANPEENKENE